MFDKVLISAGLVIAMTGQAAALSPVSPSHESPPPRISEPDLLVAAEPVPVVPYIPYCGVPMPVPAEPVEPNVWYQLEPGASQAEIVQAGPHVLWLQQPEPDAALTPIATTPIQ